MILVTNKIEHYVYFAWSTDAYFFIYFLFCGWGIPNCLLVEYFRYDLLQTKKFLNSQFSFIKMFISYANLPISRSHRLITYDFWDIKNKVENAQKFLWYFPKRYIPQLWVIWKFGNKNDQQWFNNKGHPILIENVIW